MVGMPFCSCFTIPNQRSFTGFALPLATRSRKLLHPNSSAKQNQLWQNLDSNASDRWSDRRGKTKTFPCALGAPAMRGIWSNSSLPGTVWCILQRKHWRPGSRQKTSRRHFYRNRRLWVDFHLDTVVTRKQSVLGAMPASAGPSEKIQSLCAMGQLDKALDTLSSMDQRAAVPSLHMYRSLLTECSKRKALAQAMRVYAHLTKHGLDNTSILGEAVVCTFVKCGSLKDALQVFRKLPFRSVVSWNAMISGYTSAGQGQEALRLYRHMREEGLEPDTYTFVILIKACGTIADLKSIHAEAAKYRYEYDLFVGTCLVNSYAKRGRIVDAQNVFDRLPQRNSVSWNAMLTAHIQLGQAWKALQLYEGMLEEGISQDDRTIVKALQACSILSENEECTRAEGKSLKVKSLKIGKVIHSEAWQRDCSGDLFVGSSLVGMYGKCGSIVDAQVVFDELYQQDLVTWNSMLTAYVQQGEAEKALQLYGRMVEQNVSSNDRTFVSALQACAVLAEKYDTVGDDGCAKLKFLEKGKALHVEARRKGYEGDIYVGNSLVSMYAKCGNIADAQYVFDELLVRDDVSWNTLLAAYAQQGNGELTLDIYEQMQLEDVSPNDRTFVSVLQGCGMLADEEDLVDEMATKWKSLERGKALHADAKRRGYDSDAFVSSSLISMYGKCGSIVDAQNAFDGLSKRDVVSWTVLLAGYVQQGLADKVLQLYEQMQEEGMSPNDRTLVNTLQSCGILADGEEGAIVDGQVTKLQSLGRAKTIHAEVWRKGHHSDVFVGSTLISMYSKCGSIVDTQHVFNGLSQRDVVAWSAMVAAFVQQGQAENALEIYAQMQEENVSPNIWTFASVMHACGMLAEKEEDGVVDGTSSRLESLKKSKVVHAKAHRKGCDQDVFIGSTLIRMYGKCGSMLDSQIVFDGLNCRDVGLWNAMLAAYDQQDQAEKALDLYEQMWEEGVTPDAGTFVTALQACGSLADKDMDGHLAKVQSLGKGKAIHAVTRRIGYDADAVVCNSLITMYSKCGSVTDSCFVFDGLSAKDVVSWNAMLAAYVEHDEDDKALQLYGQMQQAGMTPTPITLLCVAQACSNTGSLDMCRQIHQTATSLENPLSPLLATTLIHAYGRCATMQDAQAVFDSLPEPGVVSWNALITGYAREGNYAASLQHYQEMLFTGTKPDKVTFLALLSACSHAGLVDKGLQYFESMTKDYGFTPDIEHYVSIVDLLGRAGHFTMVEHLLSTMPMEPDLAMWSCLLGTCRKHGKVALGKQAFDHAVRLDPKQSATYILMANIYADAGLWDLAKQVKESSQREVGWKQPGQSWTRHEQKGSTFMVGDRNNPQQHLLYNVLEKLASEPDGGYVPCEA